MVLTCVVCRSESFDETETGFFVCVRCGTQSQDVVREVEDEEMAFNSLAGRGQRGRRITAGATTPGGIANNANANTINAVPPPRGAVGADWNLSAAAATDAAANAAANAAAAAAAANRADVYEQVVAYCEGIQRLVHAQCVTLAADFGCPPEMPQVARAIWFPYLRATGVLDLDFNDPDTYLAPTKRSSVRSRARAAAAGRDAAAAGGAGGEGGGAGAGGAAAAAAAGGDGALGRRAVKREREDDDDDDDVHEENDDEEEEDASDDEEYDDDEGLDDEERERRRRHRRRRRRREKRRRRREREEEEEEDDDDDDEHDHPEPTKRRSLRRLLTAHLPLRVTLSAGSSIRSCIW